MLTTSIKTKLNPSHECWCQGDVLPCSLYHYTAAVVVTTREQTSYSAALLAGMANV